MDARSETERLREAFRERARILSEVPAAEESGERISILSFMLGGEVYGIDLRHLVETRRFVSLRRLPSAPSHLIGIINLRGEILPVLDPRPLLGLPRPEVPHIMPALVVLSWKSTRCALFVDRALDIHSFTVREIHPPPLSLEPEKVGFVKGEVLVGPLPLSLLDIEKLLQEALSGNKS